VPLFYYSMPRFSLTGHIGVLIYLQFYLPCLSLTKSISLLKPWMIFAVKSDTLSCSQSWSYEWGCNFQDLVSCPMNSLLFYLLDGLTVMTSFGI
jgi:hypothetical protein